MARRKPIQGNRKQDVRISGAEARAAESAADALTGKGEISTKTAGQLADRLREVGSRFRDADRSASRKAARKKNKK